MCRKLIAERLGLAPLREGRSKDRRRSWGAGASGASADPTESSEADLALQSCLVLRLEAWALHHPVTFFLCVKLQWASHPLEVSVMYAFSD